MRDISELDGVVAKLMIDIGKGIVKGTEKASKDLAKEVRSRATLPPEATLYPVELDKYMNQLVFPEYLSSIRSIPVKDDGVSVRGGVRSKYVVFWGKYNCFVPFGMFIEWGTGPVGARTVSTPFVSDGFDYTYVEWDKYTQKQWLEFGEFGMSARPHWYPAVRTFAPQLSETLKKYIRMSIKRG